MDDREFGEAIRTATKRKGWTQRELARRMIRKEQYVSDLIKGKRPKQHQDMTNMVELFDDPEFCLAVAAYYTDGVAGARLAGIDGGRAGAAICVNRELNDVRDIIEEAQVALMTPPAEHERELATEVALELMEAQAALNEKLIRLAHDHDLSVSELVNERRKRLASKGYTQEKSRLREQAAVEASAG